VWVAQGGEPSKMRDLRAKSGSDHETGKHLGQRNACTLEAHYRRAPKSVDAVDIVRAEGE